MPDRASRVTSDVLRLAGEVEETRHRYEEAQHMAEAQEVRAQEIGRRLQGRRAVSDTLREDLGSAARAQYRTGGFTTVPADDSEADDPFDLMALQLPDARRRARLAWMLDEDDRKSRSLVAEEQELAAAQVNADKDREQLQAHVRAAETRLAAARADLNVMAQGAIDSGRCTPLPLDRAAAGGGTAKDQAVAQANGRWTRPVTTYQLTAGFGGVGANWASTHSGQDFAVPSGTPVRSIGAGTVVATGCGGAFGISLVVQHDDGWYSQYAHLAAMFVRPGQQVRAGQWIGMSGTTGNSTGPHLHFEIRTSPEFGSAVDPVPWLNARGVRL
ncbi:M23 family metallopeptidase [Streptomyces roseoverticillatus]|uniref:M23 family metallopeptidase n=1 Tax=Streptomyces roseoverticillatus TaxID=66429 RepID=UPI001F24DF6D|nr:M23 family metallopeptidase [Streptomyces roseoverticillatus]MCF3100260.1 M23 family metallopeptidase [Streptomyces roseoverticillatus]